MSKYRFGSIREVGKLKDLSVIVISGSHSLFADMIINDIKHREDVESDVSSSLAIGTSLADEFEANDEADSTLTLDEFFKVCNSVSPLGKWLCRVDYDFATKKEQERIKSYMKKPSTNAILIVTVTEFKNIRDLRSQRCLNESKLSHYIDIQYPMKRVLSEIVVELFKKRGYTVNDQCVALFMLKMGTAYNEYNNCIDAIAERLKGSGEEIGEDSDKTIADTAEQEAERVAGEAIVFDNEDEAVDEYSMFLSMLKETYLGDDADLMDDMLDDEDLAVDSEDDADLYDDVEDSFDDIEIAELMEDDALEEFDAESYEEYKRQEANAWLSVFDGMIEAPMEVGHEEKWKDTDKQDKINVVERAEHQKSVFINFKDFKEAMKGIDFFVIDDFLQELLKPIHTTKVSKNRKLYKILGTLLEDYTASDICNKLKYRVEELLYYRAYINRGFIPVKTRYNTEKVKERLPENSRLRKATSLTFKRNAVIAAQTSIEDWYFMYSILNSAGAWASEDKYKAILFTLMGRTSISNDRLMNAVKVKDMFSEELSALNGIMSSPWWRSLERRSSNEESIDDEKPD